MSSEIAYRDACAKAQIAKEKFAETSREAKARIAPARLKQDVIANAKMSASDLAARASAKVKERPIASGAAGIAFLLFLARRPVMALLKRSYVHCRNVYSRDTETDHG